MVDKGGEREGRVIWEEEGETWLVRYLWRVRFLRFRGDIVPQAFLRVEDGRRRLFQQDGEIHASA